MSEGRMRMQETNKFSSSLEANISFVDRRAGGSGGGGVTKITPSASPMTKAAINTVKAKNYDAAKNPFGDDDSEEAESKPKEYDNNLNPFE